MEVTSSVAKVATTLSTFFVFQPRPLIRVITTRSCAMKHARILSLVAAMLLVAIPSAHAGLDGVGGFPEAPVEEAAVEPETPIEPEAAAEVSPEAATAETPATTPAEPEAEPEEPAEEATPEEPESEPVSYLPTYIEQLIGDIKVRKSDCEADLDTIAGATGKAQKLFKIFTKEKEDKKLGQFAKQTSTAVGTVKPAVDRCVTDRDDEIERLKKIDIWFSYFTDLMGANQIEDMLQLADLKGELVLVVGEGNVVAGKVSSYEDKKLSVKPEGSDKFEIFAAEDIKSGKYRVYVLKLKKGKGGGAADPEGFFAGVMLRAAALGNHEEVIAAFAEAEFGYALKGFLDVGGRFGLAGFHGIADYRHFDPTKTVDLAPSGSLFARPKKCFDSGACIGVEAEFALLPKVGFGLAAVLSRNFDAGTLQFLLGYMYRPSDASAGIVDGQSIDERVRVQGVQTGLGWNFKLKKK